MDIQPYKRVFSENQKPLKENIGALERKVKNLSEEINQGCGDNPLVAAGLVSVFIKGMAECFAQKKNIDYLNSACKSAMDFVEKESRKYQ